MKKYDYILENDWYMQGTPCVPFYGVDQYSTTFDVFGDKNALVYFIGDDNRGFFSKNYFNKVIPLFIEKQKKDAGFVDKLYKKWRLYVNKFEKLANDLGKKDIGKLQKNEIDNYLKQFRDINHSSWCNALIHEILDPDGEIVLKEQVMKYGFNLPDDVIKDMIMPSKALYQNLAERDLMLIALKEMRNQNTEKDTNEYVKKYHFIRNTWSHVFLLNKKDFLPKINEYKKFSESELRNKIQKIDSYEQVAEKKRNELIKKYKFPKGLLNIFYFYKRLAEWRDERKTIAQRTNYWMFLILRRLSGLVDIKIYLLFYSFTSELAEYIAKGFPSDFVNILKQRIKKCVFLRENKVTKLIVGKEAEYIINLIDNYYFKTSGEEITGQIGNKGFVKARVKIILHHRDFKKLKKRSNSCSND